jgi:hypothetical protein
MRHWLSKALWAAGLLLLPWAARAQRTEALLVPIGHSNFYPAPGVTAAYSMDTNVVLASAEAGGFQLTGQTAGETTVMLVSVGGVRTLTVTVPAPRMPARMSGSDMSVEGQTVEFGQEELRYNNNPNQITSVQNMTQIAGDRQIHIQIMNANIFPAQGQAPVGFPLLSYEISRPGRRVTLVDEMMGNTDLTMTGVLLRGFHLQQGPWEFHGGITSITEFQDFLLPSTRYEVAGISRHFKLNERSSLEGNLYYFRTNTAVNTTATPGLIGTLFYQYTPNGHMHATAEFGVGQGFAVAGKLTRDTAKQMLQATFHYETPHIASLNINVLHGRTADVMWQMHTSKRSETQIFADDTDINLASDQQQVDTATVNETFWFTTHLGATGGYTASRFTSIVPVAPTVASSGVLAGPQMLWKHFGGSFSYQALHNSGNVPNSNNFQATAQGSVSRLSTSVFYNLQRQAPVFAPVTSPQVDLRQAVLYESQMALNPSQMVNFLHESSTLTSQGYISPLVVTVAAKREQYGVTMDWAGEKSGHISFNSLLNSSTGGGLPAVRLATGGLLWTRRFGTANLLSVGFSLYRSSTNGQTTTQPVEQFSFQHQLNSVPRFLVPGRRGTIEGHVFMDTAFAQSYAQGDPPLAGVLVYLDGRRTTHTDKSGYFSFHGVPYGIHRVEAEFHDSRPFFYTSSSPKSVGSNGTADFGVSFAQGRIFGKFTNDAGDGMGVTLELEGRGLRREIQTSGDGSIEIDGLPDGTYTIRPLTSSLPPGYSFANLDDKTISVTAQQAGHFQFTAQAQRTIAGKVESFDTATGKNIPLAGVEVSLPELHLSTHTDAQGRYLFRRLSAGSVTVTVNYEGKTYTHPVLLLSAPDAESGIDIVVPAQHGPAHH